jgi:hypothetical protein
VALEAAQCLALGLALGETAGDVVLRRLVTAQLGEGDRLASNNERPKHERRAIADDKATPSLVAPKALKARNEVRRQLAKQYRQQVRFG